MTRPATPTRLRCSRPDGIRTAGSLPAGTYWLGDPSYALDDASWKVFNRACGDDGDSLRPLFTFRRTRAFVMPTLHGDGNFRSDLGPIPVDSGRICCLPARHVCFRYAHHGHFHTFREPFDVGWNHGRFTIGTIVIDTS